MIVAAVQLPVVVKFSQETAADDKKVRFLRKSAKRAEGQALESSHVETPARAGVVSEYLQAARIFCM